MQPGTCGLPWGPGSTSEYIYPTDENVDAFVRKMREAAGQLQLLRSARSGAYEAPAGGGALSMIELMAVVATQPCTAEALAVTGAVRAATGAPPSLRSLLSTDAAELMPQLPHRRSGPEGAEMLDVLDVQILDPLWCAKSLLHQLRALPRERISRLMRPLALAGGVLLPPVARTSRLLAPPEGSAGPVGSPVRESRRIRHLRPEDANGGETPEKRPKRATAQLAESERTPAKNRGYALLFA